MTADSPARFVSLTETHARMFEEFLAHQVALLHRDFPQAREKLKSFREQIVRHIDAEEELFDVVFAHTIDVARTRTVLGGAPIDLFTGEHKHFRTLLAEFERVTGQLDPADPDVDARILGLLEDEATFKTFFRHHDERERNLLYPALDEQVPAAKRAEMLRRFHATEGS